MRPSLKIELPKGAEVFSPDSRFWDDSPYVEFKPPHDTGFIDTQKNTSITLIIKPNGREVKKLPFTLYFRKGIGLVCAENIDSNYWWNRYNVDIENIPRIRCNYLQPYKYGLLDGIVFKFHLIDVINEGELDVKGFLINIPTRDTVTWVCSEGSELQPLNRNTLQINLNTGEKKHLVVINRFSDEESERNIQKAEFNFTSLWCDSDWNDYVK